MRSRIHWMLVLLVAILFACQTSKPPPAPTPPTPQPPVSPTPPPSTSPSSLDLIDQALEAGTITEETAYTYKVFAAFGDQRLPNQYHGADADIEDSDVLLELAPKLSAFSSNTQDTLAPFLFPPAYAGSWKNPGPPSSGGLRPQGTGIRCLGAIASGWESVNDVNGHAKVWYDSTLTGDRDKANQIAFEIDQIWVKLINQLGMKDPIKDDGRVCNGGDGRLDIYLVDMAFHGGTGDANGEAYQDHTAFTCRQFPAYLQINRNRSGAGLMSTLAHELMHASQYAYNTKSCFDTYGWIIEATATWAKDYVYPTDNDEHGYAGYFLESPEKSLEDQSTRTGKKVRDYGSYLFFQFLAHTINDNAIPKTWAATERFDSSLGAVNDAISAKGGLEKQWPEFAKFHWNLPPMDKKSYKAWDNLGNVPNLALDQDQPINAYLNGKLSLEIALKPDVPHLAVNYYDFSFYKSDTRSVLYYNPYTANPKAHVQALWKLGDDSWTEEDWTLYKFIGLCRDIKAQRITELVIIISNAEWQDTGSKLQVSDPPKFMASSVGCWKYQGTATLLEKHSSWNGLGRRAQSNFSFELDPLATALDAKNPQIPNSLRAGLNLVMPVTGTDYSFEESYSTTGCSFSLGAASFPISRTPPKGFMFTNAFPELVSSDAELQKWIAQPRRAYTSAVLDNQFVTVNVSGPGCNPTQMDVVGGLLLTNDAKNGVFLNPPVAGPNGVLSGTFKTSDASFDWNFTPKSQP
jgi:hypothetical protein